MVTELRQTYEDLMRQTDESVRHELVRGEIVCMTPPKGRHGRVEAALGGAVWGYLRERALALGWEEEQGALVCDLLVGASAMGEFGIRITLPDDPDQVRGLDFCYLSPEQVARYEANGPDEYFTEMPVLVAEVISPSESADYIAEKVHDFLTGGARLVWLLFPRTRSVQIYQSDRSTRMISGDARLEGGEVLPGFSVALSSLFA
ncbi:MAG TPA: Uma2 family endonuclease, partial [Chloroflexota bacterium]|nr:Uma2 family endonuclease [Chloroflexota bacterium]